MLPVLSWKTVFHQHSPPLSSFIHFISKLPVPSAWTLLFKNRSWQVKFICACVVLLICLCVDTCSCDYLTWYAIHCQVSVKPAPRSFSPAMFSIQRAGAVVIWILRQVAGVFVCSYGPDNLVTLLSSGAGSPCSPEPPCVPPSVPEFHPPHHPLPAYRHFETADDGKALDVSLKNHLLSIFIQPPTPTTVSNPHLRWWMTVINIHQGMQCMVAVAPVPTQQRVP